MKPRVRDTAHLSSVPSEMCRQFFLPILSTSLNRHQLSFQMFANLKCLREGSFQITINNLRLHLPLCNKGVIYGGIERSFMTLYDFKERPLMNVPPHECNSSSLFYVSLMHHNIIHFLITMCAEFGGFNLVWLSEFVLS